MSNLEIKCLSQVFGKKKSESKPSFQINKADAIPTTMLLTGPNLNSVKPINPIALREWPKLHGSCRSECNMVNDSISINDNDRL